MLEARGCLLCPQCNVGVFQFLRVKKMTRTQTLQVKMSLFLQGCPGCWLRQDGEVSRCCTLFQVSVNRNVFTCAVSSLSLSMASPWRCRPLALTERSCFRFLMSSWTLEMAFDDIRLISSWTCFWSFTNFLKRH